LFLFDSLLVQLARDLQTDFYKHFREFFDILVQLLNDHPQDTELLEKMFSALSYLLKFLWRYLVKDIKEVYGLVYNYRCLINIDFILFPLLFEFIKTLNSP